VAASSAPVAIPPASARPARAVALRRRLRGVPAPLAALLAAATLLSLAWTVLMAPLQGPDEHNHVAYAQQLAETGDGPLWGTTTGGTHSTESTALQTWADLTPLIGVLTARPGWTDAEERAYEQVSRDARRDDGSGPNAVAQNPPLYYGYEAVAYRVGSGWSLPARLLLMRLANLPLLLLVVVCTWLAVGEAFGRRRFLQTVGAGIAAFLPMLGFMSGVVNPDIGLAAAFAGFTALALAALRLGPRPSVVLGLGAVGAAAVLTHGRGLAVLPPLLVVLALLGWRALRELPLRRTLGLALGVGAIVALGGLLAVAYSSGHGEGSSIGGEVGNSAGHGNLRGFVAYVWQFYFSPLVSMAPPPGPPYGFRQVYVETFAGGTFGSLEIQFPLWVYSTLQVAVALGLATLFGAIVRRWEAVRAHAAPVLVVASIVASVLLTIHFAAYGDLSAGSPDPLITGRYLLPLVAPLALAAVFVVDSLPRRLGVAVGTALVTGWALLSLSALALTLARFYV
jgi:4-amino-4-deoxy-L-arabinose transferase-like glycosyltransferase